MNRVILMGRLVRDADVRYSQGNNPTAVAKFTLAVQRKFKRDNETDCDFINCVAFGKQAEFIEKYIRKGNRILVEGRWQSGSFINRDGQKVYTNDCMVENCEFAESKGTNQKGNQGQIPPRMTETDSNGFMNIPDGIDEELPFA